MGQVPRRYDVMDQLEGLSRPQLNLPILGSTNWGLVSSLPASPTVGDRCYYNADAVNGIIWELLYDGVGTLPWKKLGGLPLLAEVTTAQSTASTTYVNLTTVGPSITAPLKGDYRIGVGNENWNSNALQACFMSFALGGTGAVDADSVGNSTPVNNGRLSAGRPAKVKTGIAAATAIVAKYRVDGGASGNFQNRWLSVEPVRVG